MKVSAFLAVSEADLKVILKGRLTVAWVAVAIFIQVVRVLGSGGSGTVSSVVASGLSDFLYIWALVLIGLSGGAVSSEAGQLADSILSKSVTRFDYVLAKFASRIAYALVTFSGVTAVLVGLSLKADADGYNGRGLAAAVILVALAMVALVSMGVGLSVIMPNTMSAIITLLVVWYAMTFFLPILGLDAVSPGHLAVGLSKVAEGSWEIQDWETVAGYLSISVASVVLSSAYFHLKDI